MVPAFDDTIETPLLEVLVPLLLSCVFVWLGTFDVEFLEFPLDLRCFEPDAVAKVDDDEFTIDAAWEDDTDFNEADVEAVLWWLDGNVSDSFSGDDGGSLEPVSFATGL